MKKILSVFLAILVVFSMMGVSAYAADLPTEPDTPQMSFGDFMKSFVDALKNYFANISVEDLLKLPANSMATVVTFIFQALSLIGLNLDGIYEKIGQIFG